LRRDARHGGEHDTCRPDDFDRIIHSNSSLFFARNHQPVAATIIPVTKAKGAAE
jgi:hypothetical protein